MTDSTSRPLLRLARLLLSERPRIAAAVSLQVLTIAAGVGLMGTSAWLLSKAALHPSIAALSLAIVGVRAFGIARAVARYLERLVSHDVTLRLLARLRLTLFRALAPLAPAGLLDRRGGDLLARLLVDVGTLENLYARLVGPSLAAVLVTALVAALVAWFLPALALVALCGLALGGVLVPRLAARLGDAPGRRLVERRGELLAGLVDGVRGVPDLLAFGREAGHARSLALLSREAVRDQRRLVRASALGGSLATLAADLTAVAALALAIPAVTAGRLDGVQLATVVLVALAAFEAVAPLPLAWHALSATRGAARRLVEVVDTPPPVSEPQPPAPGPVVDAAVLELRDLRFSYPGEARPALDGVSLRLERGRRIALVGASGAGKSTLVQLLLRFWPAPPGSLWLAGHDLADWPSDEARARIAYAAQRAHVFTGSLRENLRLGRPDAGEGELLDVLRRVRLDALLVRLPEGLDGWIGAEGQALSGGERQRLALARALLREAPLFVLDEPFAHLDALTERSLMDEVLRAGEGRATLLVTHRLVSLEAFDEVLVLERGRVLERGSAAELLAREQGALSRLLALQRSVEALGDAAWRGSGG